MKCSVCGGDCWAGSSTGTCSECLQFIIASSVPDVDKPAEPEEGDWVTEDHLTFREHGGSGVIRIPLGGPWQWAVKDRMNREQFWPNVWFISDHGNAHLLSLEDDE